MQSVPIDILDQTLDLLIDRLKDKYIFSGPVEFVNHLVTRRFKVSEIDIQELLDSDPVGIQALKMCQDLDVNLKAELSREINRRSTKTSKERY